MANHTTTKASLNRFNIVENPKCDCGMYHNIDHVFFECHITKKQEVINNLIKLGYKEPLSTRDILGMELQSERYDGMEIISNGYKDEL